MVDKLWTFILAVGFVAAWGVPTLVLYLLLVNLASKLSR